MLLTGARHHPTNHIHLHAWTASTALGQHLFLLSLPPVSARYRPLVQKTAFLHRREGVSLHAAVSLLQLYQDGRSEHICSGICHIFSFQLAGFTFPVLSRRTAVMDNHWPTAPGLQDDK